MRADEFLHAAIEWVAIRDAVRAAYPNETSAFHAILCAFYREAAWCHVLLRAHRYAPIVTRLKFLDAKFFGAESATRVRLRPNRIHTQEFAADVFARFRVEASERYPEAFARLARPGASLRRPA